MQQNTNTGKSSSGWLSGWSTGLRHLSVLVLIIAAGAVFFQSYASADTRIYPFAQLSHAQGFISVQNPTPQQEITTLIFTNRGSSSISISRIEVQSNFQIINATVGNEAIEVGPGASVSVNFSSAKISVQSIDFVITGSTELLEIMSNDRSFPVPGGFSSGN